MAEVRLRRGEREAMLYLMNIVSSIAWAKDDLKERLTLIPDGTERLDAALEHFTKLLDDLIWTVPVHQCVSLKHTAEDYQLRSVPKSMPNPANVLLTRDNVKVLIDCAQEGKCVACVLNGKECRRCELEKALECITPMTDYKGELCPYNMATWEE